MSIVNPIQMLKKAYINKYAILHANVVNPQMSRTIIETCEKLNSPVIIAISEKALRQFTSPLDFATTIRTMVHDLKIKVPVAIHLDHGEYNTVLKAIKSGFTSVMFDGSKLPLKENLRKTKTIVQLAKKYHVAVEAEVGTVPGKIEDKGKHGQLATVEECVLIAKTGINFLAAGIGNLHGKYPQD
jgi:fructose-bisphosphate aldolase class II